MKIILADDATLIREGLASLLDRCGHQVVAQMSSSEELTAWSDKAMSEDLPDIVVTDVRMPPSMTDDGLRAALYVRQRFPQLPIMVLSQFVAPTFANRLLDGGVGSGGTGYLLKERVGRPSEFVHSLQLVARGGVVIDKIVATELADAGADNALSLLTSREREVLQLMAEGLSNSDIADKLVVSKAAVAKHVANIFLKLGMLPDEENRRVRAILKYYSAVRKFDYRMDTFEH